MDEDKQKVYHGLAQTLRDRLGEERMEELATFAFRFGVMTAIFYTGTLDRDVLAKWLYEDKDHAAPLTIMQEIVENYLPILRHEGMLLGNKLTPVAIELVRAHETMLAETTPTLQ